jgi:hypothetical protein
MFANDWADVGLHDGVVRAGNVRGPSFDAGHHQQGPQMGWSVVARCEYSLKGNSNNVKKGNLSKCYKIFIYYYSSRAENRECLVMII